MAPRPMMMRHMAAAGEFAFVGGYGTVVAESPLGIHFGAGCGGVAVLCHAVSVSSGDSHRQHIWIQKRGLMTTYIAWAHAYAHCNLAQIALTMCTKEKKEQGPCNKRKKNSIALGIKIGPNIIKAQFVKHFCRPAQTLLGPQVGYKLGVVSMGGLIIGELGLLKHRFKLIDSH